MFADMYLDLFAYKNKPYFVAMSPLIDHRYSVVPFMILLKNAPDLEYFIYSSSFVLFSVNWDKKNQGCGGDCPGRGNHIWLKIPVESEQGGLRFPIPRSPGRIQGD